MAIRIWNRTPRAIYVGSRTPEEYNGNEKTRPETPPTPVGDEYIELKIAVWDRYQYNWYIAIWIAWENAVRGGVWVAYDRYISIDWGTETRFTWVSRSSWGLLLAQWTPWEIHTVRIRPATVDYWWARAFGNGSGNCGKYIKEIIHDNTYMWFAVSATETWDYFRYAQYDGAEITSAPAEVMPNTVTKIWNMFRADQYRGCVYLQDAPEEVMSYNLWYNSDLGSNYRIYQYQNCSSLRTASLLATYKDNWYGGKSREASDARRYQFDGAWTAWSNMVIDIRGTVVLPNSAGLSNSTIAQIKVSPNLITAYQQSSVWSGITSSKFQAHTAVYKGAWVYCDSTRELMTLSSDWLNWITLSSVDLSWLFQWGNNFPFDTSGLPQYVQWESVSNVKVDTTGYWPWNYYNSSTFITVPTGEDWSNPNNNNLWGANTNTNVARQWPCSSGFHVPSSNEWQTIIAILTALWIATPSDIANYLKISWDTAFSESADWEESWVYRRSSDAKTSDYDKGACLHITDSVVPSDGVSKAKALLIRPFKDSTEIATQDREILFTPTV